MAYRILSLDGGGMRGLITVRLLQRLTRSFPELLEHTDLIAGTSTGGLIALALARGLTPERILELYEQRAAEIFTDSPLDDLADLGRVLGAEYDTAGLRAVLEEQLGDATLADLGRRVLIPALDLDSGEQPGRERRWKAKVFHNFPGPDSDGAMPAWLVGLYTSAAPTYFPSVDGFIDGGVVAANPAMCALAQTQDERSFAQPPELREISLLSLGTGEVAQYLAGDSHDWGAVQWGRPLVEILLGATVEVPVYQCRSMLGRRFARLSPQLRREDGLALDSHRPEALQRMRAIADATDLQATLAWLGEFW